MKTNLWLLSIVLIAVTVLFACNSSDAALSQALNKQNEVTIEKNNETKDKENRELKKGNSFIGCWSSYNGEILRITDNHVMVSVNSFKPVNYLQESDSMDGVILLRLINRPQFYYFQDYVSLQFSINEFEKTEMKIKDFINYDDFLNKKNNGISAWVKDDCNKLFPPKQGFVSKVLLR